MLHLKSFECRTLFIAALAATSITAGACKDKPTPAAPKAQSTNATNANIVPELIHTHITSSTPQKLSSFKVGPTVTRITTFKWKSKNPDVNGKPKTHRLFSQLPINDGLTIDNFLMKNFYGYDAKQHFTKTLSAIRSSCAGEKQNNGLIKYTAEALKNASAPCKAALKEFTGKRPLYISQKSTAQPVYLTCTSSCKMKVVKWNYIGFDVQIPLEKIGQWRDVQSASYDHLDKILTPAGK